MAKISIVIPVYEGAATIGGLADELIKDLNNRELEVILVNDGSRDASHEACISIFRRYPGLVKYIRLARNFGEHNAVLAGLKYAEGDYAVIIDDDFQNPPGEVRKLVDTAQSGGYDVVYTCYDKKQHSWFRNIGSAFNNLIASFLLEKPLSLYLSSFKCINRFMTRELIKYTGPFPYIDGLILRTTRNIGKVMVRHEKRQGGKSGYTLRKLIRLWLNMLVNFSVQPLRVSAFLGLLFACVGGLSAAYLIFEKFMHPETPVGYTSIIVSIIVLSGIQLMMLGLIGEYIGKQFMTSNQAPQYVVREAWIGRTGSSKDESGRNQ